MTEQCWTANALNEDEFSFVETHAGGSDARTFAELRTVLDAEVHGDYVTDTPWCYANSNNSDHEGWTYSAGDTKAAAWFPESFARAYTRRRTWYRVARDPTSSLDKVRGAFGSNIPVDNRILIR